MSGSGTYRKPDNIEFGDSKLPTTDGGVGLSPYTERMVQLTLAVLLAFAVLVQPLLAHGQSLSQEVDQIFAAYIKHALRGVRSE